MEADPPRKGMAVDFTTVGDQAWWIKAAGAARTAYTKSKLVAGLLAIFLGSLDIHKFYLGYRMPGIILLLCTIVPSLLVPELTASTSTQVTTLTLLLSIPAFIAQLIGPIEGIIYLIKKADKFNEEYVVQKKPWF